MTTQRELFEASYAAKWKAATGKDQSVAELAAVVVTMRDGDGYHDGAGGRPPYINNLWEGWQMARSAKPLCHKCHGDGLTHATHCDQHERAS